MGVFISYRLTGKGWSECSVLIEDQQAVVTASYLSDALGDILAAATVVLQGAPEATASFAEEPGEYRWRFIRVGMDRLIIRILEFSQWWGNRPDKEGKLVLEAECRLRTFAGALRSASQRVLEDHGIDGYREKWGNNDFPIDQQTRLVLIVWIPSDGANRVFHGEYAWHPHR